MKWVTSVEIGPRAAGGEASSATGQGRVRSRDQSSSHFDAPVIHGLIFLP